MPAVAMRPNGVGTWPNHGMAPGMAMAILKDSDAQKSAKAVVIVAVR